MSMTMQSRELPEQTISYTLRPGAEGGRVPLVLLHGGAVDARLWTPQIDAFPERTVVAPDARGHGGSSDATGPYRLTDDLVALLDALDIPRAVLVGISMGGGTAVDTALEHPDRVAALVVSGTGTSEPVFTDPWCLETFRRWRQAEQEGDLDAWIDAFMAFTAGPHRTRDDVDPGVWELVETMARETVAGHLRVDEHGMPIPPAPPVPVTRTWERLGQVEVPVLALCGAQDGPDHRAMGERLARSVAHGDYREVPGAHYPNLEDPEAFGAEVRAALERWGI